MLTRIEIDGFKSFLKLKLDLQPFTVIFGGNAVGKSNLFDALRLLARLAGSDVATAFSEEDRPGAQEAPRGEPIEQFRRGGNGEIAPRIDLAVEVLLPPRVRDAWGAVMELGQTRLRYEVAIERRVEGGRQRLLVAHEAAKPLSRTSGWHLGGKPMSAAFRDAFLKTRRRSDFLSSGIEQGRPVIRLHQDSKQGRTRSSSAAEATVLSSITSSAEFPHLYALREELRSMHFLQLDPVAMRQPSPAMGPELLRGDGRNLASVLARIEQDTATTDRPQGRLPDIRADLTSLVPGIVDLLVVHEQSERRYRVEIVTRDGMKLSSRVVSDGTLRLLALSTMLHDPQRRSVICFEEPENGVFKSCLPDLIETLWISCTDPAAEEIDAMEPLSQILVNTHSPVVARALLGREVVVADLVRRLEPSALHSEILTRMRPRTVSNQDALFDDPAATVIGQGEIERFGEARDTVAA